MGVRPLHDRVFIKRIDAQETTKGGIIIPDAVAEKPQEGVVFAIGTGTILPDGTVVPLDVKKGDRVLFGQHSGNEVTIVDGEEYVILDEREILVVIES